jgi:Zn-dependent protease
LFACVVLHEFGHIAAARRYGIATPEVTLLPIGGVASLQRLPSDPKQELVVALAGPAVNLVIGLVLIALVGSIHRDELTQIDDPNLSLVGRLAIANIFLAVFNLIPAFPMDGGRVLHALVAMRVGGPRATEIAARIGQALAFGLGFLGLFGNPLLVFIAIFVYIAAAAEAQMSAGREALKGVSVGQAMETRFTPLAIDASLGQAVDALLATAQHEFPVVDAFGKPAGLLTREDILNAVREHGGDEPASMFMRSGVESVRSSTPVASVFERLAGPGRRCALRHRRRRQDRRPRHPPGAGRGDDDPRRTARLAVRAQGLRRRVDSAPSASNMARGEGFDRMDHEQNRTQFAGACPLRSGVLRR